MFVHCVKPLLASAGKAFVEWKRGPQPQAAGDVASSEALKGVIEELMNAVSYLTHADGFFDYVTARIFLCLTILYTSLDYIVYLPS